MEKNLKRPAHSAKVTTYNNSALLLKSFIAGVLKCKVNGFVLQCVP